MESISKCLCSGHNDNPSTNMSCLNISLNAGSYSMSIHCPNVSSNSPSNSQPKSTTFSPSLHTSQELCQHQSFPSSRLHSSSQSSQSSRGMNKSVLLCCWKDLLHSLLLCQSGGAQTAKASHIPAVLHA